MNDTSNNTLWQGRNVVLGVTGGIAAFKSCSVASTLRQNGAKVTGIMTKHAQEFVTPLTFHSLTGNKVVTGLFGDDETWDSQHIALSKSADIVIVTPATANLIGKHAQGIADDFLTTFLLAVRAPILMAPAMNSNMYLHAATQENMTRLKQRGIHFVDPGEGHLACGDIGPGRMAEPEEIILAAEKLLSRSRDLDGLKVLVSAGPTREFLDPARFLSNPSTGKMGIAVAEEARDRGAKVTLVLGPTHLPDPAGMATVRVQSAEEMAQEVFAREDSSDVIICAAAVSDFKPKEKLAHKKKKSESDEALSLERTTDILGTLGTRKGKKILVGFAAESDNLEENAKVKLKEKNSDLVFANAISGEDSAFASDSNAGTLFARNGSSEAIPAMSKRAVAARIWGKIAILRNE